MLLATASLVGGRVPAVSKGFHFGQPPPITNREFMQRRRRRQRERQKSNRFWQAKQQLCRCITFFDTFLYLRCTTTTWNCLISRFVAGRGQKTTTFFFFSGTLMEPFRINSTKICQNLTNQTRWNKRDKVWVSTNSPFKWRFRSRRRRHCVNSLMAPTWLARLHNLAVRPFT